MGFCGVVDYLASLPTVSLKCVHHHVTLSSVAFGWVVLKRVVPRLPCDIPSPAPSQICTHPQGEVSDLEGAYRDFEMGQCLWSSVSN